MTLGVAILGGGKTLDDLLARSDIQAVIIALPIKNQPDHIRKALLAGKHVLSEKPVAEDTKEAVELIKWYRSEIVGDYVTWAVAENVRYMNSFIHAAEAVQTKGRQLTFRRRMQTLVEGGKYFETSWRKAPAHQGGFLVDGGVHYTAVLRWARGEALAAGTVNERQSPEEALANLELIEAMLRSGKQGSIPITLKYQEP